MPGKFCPCPRIRLNAGSWIVLCTVAILIFNMIIKITFCVHTGNLGLATATSSSDTWSEFLGSGIFPQRCCEMRFPPAPGALQVGALVLTQPSVLSTPCSPFLGPVHEKMGLAYEFFHSFLSWLFFIRGLSQILGFL